GIMPHTPADDFGEIFLMASDHLPLQATKPDATEDKLIWLAANMLPVQEASAIHEFDLSTIRSHLMLSESLPKLNGEAYFDIPSLFEGVTQMSLLTFQSLTFGALTKFVKFDVAQFIKEPRHYRLQESWFASTKIPSAQVSAFLNFVSATPDELASVISKSNTG